MKKSNYIIFAIIVLILVGFAFIIKSTKQIYKSINLDEISSLENGLVHVGKISDDVTSTFKEYFDNYNLKSYNMDNTKMSSLSALIKNNNLEEVTDDNGYLLIHDSKIVWVSGENLNNTELNEAVLINFYNKIPTDQVVYKVPKDGDEMVKLIKRKNKFTVLVIGKQDCNYCQMYMPVFNKVAKDSNLDIYYIDSTTYNKSEYKKITDLELEIPAYCTTNNTKTSTAGSFPKPMTFIIKDGKTVSCALGYKSEDNLKSFLFSYGVINQI